MFGKGKDVDLGSSAQLLGGDPDTDALGKMAGQLTWGKDDPLLRLLILLIGIHSCALGVVMLFAPHFMLQLFGFPEGIPAFFPSQSGIFLLILGICYLLAMAEPELVKIIVISKAFAVVFLFIHVVFLMAPPAIWAAAFGDSAMLAAVCAALFRHRRLARVQVNDGALPR